MGLWEIIRDSQLTSRADVGRIVSSIRRKQIRRQGRVDRNQDERIAELETEVNELRVDLAATVSLLITKGVLDAEECRVIAEAVDGEE